MYYACPTVLKRCLGTSLEIKQVYLTNIVKIYTKYCTKAKYFPRHKVTKLYLPEIYHC